MSNVQLKQVIAVFAASSSANRTAESPSYAAYVVNAQVLASLEAMVANALKDEYSEIRKTASPDWGPDGIETLLRLQDGELVVTPSGRFWFTDTAKGGVQITTDVIDLSRLREKFEAAAQDDVVYLSVDAYERTAYLEDHPEITPEKSAEFLAGHAAYDKGIFDNPHLGKNLNVAENEQAANDWAAGFNGRLVELGLAKSK